MKRFMKPACIFIAALLFISTEHCNASVLKDLDEDYKREVELKTPAISGGKVVSRYSRLYFCFSFSFPMSFILVVNFKRLNFNKVSSNSDDIYVICRPGGPYWERLCPRS